MSIAAFWSVLGSPAWGAPPAPTPVATAGAHDPTAFARLAERLGGVWTTPQGVTATYTLVSRGSTLVERWTTGGGETLTVYHPDGDGVLATHYCAQGNQPTLRLTTSDGQTYHFERERVTNLGPGQGVLSTLVLGFEGETLVRTETYVDDAGAREVTTHRFAHAPR
jgi:hypothetical protein